MSSSTAQLTPFYDEYVKALDDKQAALFIGAGMSVQAGFPTWANLLRNVADELKLDINKETDLVALAQFHFNEQQVRTRLNQLIVDEYLKDVAPTKNHQLIAKLPVTTVWTTNYDQLIEKSFQAAGKRCDIRITKANFTSSVRGRDVTVYKMHGDVSVPEETTLIKEDYEVYNLKNEIFSNAFRSDLVEKTFLFLGFSFTDPNMDYILSRIKLLMGTNARRHYCVMRWPKKPTARGKARAQYNYEMVRLGLRISDLKRYGIQAIMIDEYEEITEILETLNKRAHRKDIFISGSADFYDTMSRERIDQIAYLLGQQIIRRGFNLVTGFGLGIGGNVLIGAAEEIYRTENATLQDRLITRPFPRLATTDPLRFELYGKYRHDMLGCVRKLG